MVNFYNGILSSLVVHLYTILAVASLTIQLIVLSCISFYFSQEFCSTKPFLEDEWGGLWLNARYGFIVTTCVRMFACVAVANTNTKFFCVFEISANLCFHSWKVIILLHLFCQFLDTIQGAHCTRHLLSFFISFNR